MSGLSVKLFISQCTQYIFRYTEYYNDSSTYHTDVVIASDVLRWTPSSSTVADTNAAVCASSMARASSVFNDWRRKRPVVSWRPISENTTCLLGGYMYNTHGRRGKGWCVRWGSISKSEYMLFDVRRK